MKISIVGAAGYVGSNVATHLALQGLVDEIILIDPFKPNIIAHLAMDMGTAAAKMGCSVYAGEYPDIKDSDIVIVAAGVSEAIVASRMEKLPKNLPIIRDIAGKVVSYCPNAVVITATNPVDPLNYAMYRFTGFDRHKIIGYSTNDSLRFRMMAAQELGCKTADVGGIVIGEHGESEVLLFSTITVKGKPVQIDRATQQKIRSRIPEILRRYEALKTGRTTGVTSAAGIKDIVEAIKNNTQELIPCSAILDGEYGLDYISMGVPAILGSGGIQKIVELELAPDEIPYLNDTLAILKPAMRQVDDYPGVPMNVE